MTHLNQLSILPGQRLRFVALDSGRHDDLQSRLARPADWQGPA
jgi:hypothetical protein